MGLIFMVLNNKATFTQENVTDFYELRRIIYRFLHLRTCLNAYIRGLVRK